MTIQAIRYHDISCGHRVVGHENKCKFLHGHNYRIWFHCEAERLDNLGRVVDFSVIKQRLCMYVEDHWDHHMLIWAKDPHLEALQAIDETVVIVPFNPTAENMAEHLLTIVGPNVLADVEGIKLVKVMVEETRKCSACASL